MTTAPRSAKKWPRMLLALGVVAKLACFSSWGVWGAFFVRGVSGGNLLGDWGRGVWGDRGNYWNRVGVRRGERPTKFAVVEGRFCETPLPSGRHRHVDAETADWRPPLLVCDGNGGAKHGEKFHLVAHSVAAEMASRRVRSCTGLRRKADTPPAMARARAFGKSWPVTMMTGSAAHFRPRCACTLNPSMCGMCRSRTTQSGRRVSSDSKNSGPDPNVSTLRPTERIKRISAVRTGSSSSTTAMSRSVFVTSARE